MRRIFSGGGDCSNEGRVSITPVAMWAKATPHEVDCTAYAFQMATIMSPPSWEISFYDAESAQYAPTLEGAQESLLTGREDKR